MIITKEDAKFIADSLKEPYVAARQLSERESLSYDKWTPVNWHLRQPIIPPREVPLSSGLGYTQSPYISQWTKMWGVNPLADLGKYRLMYRTVPVIKRAIDKTVNTAIAKGFKLDLPEGTENRDQILQSVSDWIASQWNWKNTLGMIASDMLIYGSSFTEIVYDESDTETAESKDPELVQYSIPDPKENFKLNDSHIPVMQETVVSNANGRFMLVAAKGKPMWLKVLDPIWMRVRRDSFGNIFGAIQFLSVPPVAFTPAKTMIARFSQKSWWTECFVPETLVRTEFGIEEIHNVSVGERVLMDDGNFGSVEANKNFDFNGNLIEIKTAKYNVSTKATPNHPFLVKRFLGGFDRPRIYKHKFERYSDPEWIRADNLKKDDLLTISVPKEVSDRTEISDGMLRLMGFFVAEGCCDVHQNKRRTTIYFYTPKDYKNLEDIENTLKRENINYKKYYKEKSKITSIESSDRKLYDLLIECGHCAPNKRFPDWVMKLPPERQMVVLNSFVDGDGHRKKDRIDACTTSITLAHQIQTIYFRNKIMCSINKKGEPKPSVLKDGRVIVGKYPVYVVETYNGKKNLYNTGIFFEDDKVYLRIKDIKRTPYNGKVYNLDISDKETFCVDAGFIVHNSAYGVSFLQSIIRTQDAIWQLENDLILISHACAKPPLVFSCGTEDSPWTEPQFNSFVGDVGDRGPGGDVFHRGDVVAKPLPFPASSLAPLLAHLDYHNEQRMIAMGVPPDLLGVSGFGKGAASITFDDWINTIQQLQEQLADAIEEQLFKHIVEADFGEGSPVPRIVWNPIYEKDTTGEIQQIISLKNSQIITTNEARAWAEEIGKKLSPLEGGDVLGVPQVLPPETGQVEEKIGSPEEVDNLQEDQEIVNDTVESGTYESSFKSEYTDVDIEPPYLYDPESTEALKEEDFVERAWYERGLPWHKIEAPYKPEEEEASDRYKKLLPKKAGEGYEVQDEGREPNIGPEGKGRTEFPNQPPRKWPASENDPRIKKISDVENVNIWKVSGDIVHDTLDKEWKNTKEPTEHDYIAGHHFVFSYIPLNEIWISDLDKEPKKTIIHEFTERYLMKEKKMSYDEAHSIAEMVETKGIEEISKIRLYIGPREVEDLISNTIDWTRTDNIWRDETGNKILFDRAKGEVLLYNNKGDLIKKSLVRDSNDIKKFLKGI